jgi:hypothetical protein
MMFLLCPSEKNTTQVQEALSEESGMLQFLLQENRGCASTLIFSQDLAMEGGSSWTAVKQGKARGGVGLTRFQLRTFWSVSCHFLVRDNFCIFYHGRGIDHLLDEETVAPGSGGRNLPCVSRGLS